MQQLSSTVNRSWRRSSHTTPAVSLRKKKLALEAKLLAKTARQVKLRAPSDYFPQEFPIRSQSAGWTPHYLLHKRHPAGGRRREMKDFIGGSTAQPHTAHLCYDTRYYTS